MEAQPRRFDIGGARLRGGLAGADRAVNASPYVHFVRDVARQQDVRVRVMKRRRRAISGRLRRGDRRRDGHLRIEARPRAAHSRAGLGELRFGRLQRLIRDIDLMLQRVELRVAEDRPPVAARRLIVRLCQFPLGVLLEGGRGGRRRRGVGRRISAPGASRRRRRAAARVIRRAAGAITCWPRRLAAREPPRRDRSNRAGSRSPVRRPSAPTALRRCRRSRARRSPARAPPCRS